MRLLRILLIVILQTVTINYMNQFPTNEERAEALKKKRGSMSKRYAAMLVGVHFATYANLESAKNVSPMTNHLAVRWINKIGK